MANENFTITHNKQTHRCFLNDRGAVHIYDNMGNPYTIENRGEPIRTINDAKLFAINILDAFGK